MENNNSLTEKVYESILKEIVTFKIKPNEIMSESSLAKKFNISKTPVREALLKLKQEGWVSSSPNVGYVVKDFQISDIHEVFHLRDLLEGEAVYLATKNINEKEINLLEEKRRERKKILEEKQFDEYEYLKYHDEFHLAIAELSQNKRLKKFNSELLNETRRMRMYDPLMRTTELEEEESFEKQIINCLKNNKPETAREIMSTHIVESKKRIIEQIING